MLNLNPGPPILPWEEGNGEGVGLAGPQSQNDFGRATFARLNEAVEPSGAPLGGHLMWGSNT